MNFRANSSVACLGVLLLAAGSDAQPQGQYEGNCTTSGCHGDYTKRKVVHNPVTQGACDACHEAKPGEQHKFRLTQEGAALCTECHDAVTKDLAHVHGPVAVGACITCHDPHASDHAHLLVREEKVLCLQCHSAIQERIGTGSHVHRPVDDGCLGCHLGHGAKNKMMLTESPPALCLDCHDAIAAHLSANPHHHGPVAKGECGPCHEPHGTPHEGLLGGAYPSKFYAPFQEKQYALCFECHEAEAFTERLTQDATGFRDGTRNLHYLHVNQPVKGRTCRACHDPHASKDPKNVVENVPFGSWKLPLNFKATPTGGTCLPGCHQPATYNRGGTPKDTP